MVSAKPFPTFSLEYFVYTFYFVEAPFGRRAWNRAYRAL